MIFRIFWCSTGRRQPTLDVVYIAQALRRVEELIIVFPVYLSKLFFFSYNIKCLFSKKWSEYQDVDLPDPGLVNENVVTRRLSIADHRRQLSVVGSGFHIRMPWHAYKRVNNSWRWSNLVSTPDQLTPSWRRGSSRTYPLSGLFWTFVPSSGIPVLVTRVCCVLQICET